MKRMYIGLLLILGSSMASAGELLIVRGYAQSPSGGGKYMVEIAKQNAVQKLPHSNFKRVSAWGISQVSGSGGAPGVYASAVASFADNSEEGPWFVNVVESRFGWVTDKDVKETIEYGKYRVTSQARFYCNSQVVGPNTWEINTKENANGGISLSVAGRFQCVDPIVEKK